VAVAERTQERTVAVGLFVPRASNPVRVAQPRAPPA
jgi:hypothetical protein